MIEMRERELQPLRKLALSLMNCTADIERYTETQDGLDIVQEWAVVNHSIPCRIAEQQSTAAVEVVQGGRVVSTGDHVVRFPYGTDIHEGDRIKVRISRHVRHLEVSRVLEHSYATTTSVVCSEVR